MGVASSSSAQVWHWLFLPGLQAWSLYANPSARRSEASLQWILPGFDAFYQPTSEDLVMKGLWNKERIANTGYRPALDALNAIDRDLLVQALHSVAEHGCALMVGATRDHGAISLILLDGNERHKLYPANVQELDQALRDLIESFDTTKTAPAPPRKAR